MPVELGSAYGKVELDAKGVKTGSKQAQDALVGLEKSMNDTFKFTLGSLAAQGIGMLVGGLRDLYSETKTAATGFESQMAIMGTSVDPATASLETLHDAAIAVGGDLNLVGVDASQASVAMTDMFKSGMAVNDVFGDMQGYMAGTAELGGALRGSVDLQAASALDLAQAASLVNSTLDTYGLATSEASRVTDNFVKTADASKAEVTDLAAAHQNAATVMAGFGYSLEDTNTALALMSQNALKGGEAGTSLRSMLNGMLRPTEKVSAAWNELGVALYDNEGHLRRIPDIIGDMIPALQGMTEERRNELVYILAGSDGQRALNILLGQGATGWSEMEQAIAGASSAQEIAAARANTLAGAEEAMSGALETLQIQVGEQFIPMWTKMAQGVGQFATEHGPQVVAVAGKIADAVVSVMDAISGLPPELVATVEQLTALAAVAGTGYFAFVKLAPVIAALGPVLTSAVAGMQLLASGSTLAEVASLGLSAALGPIVIGLGALAVALVAVNKAIQLHKDIQEQTTTVAGLWGQKLDEIAGKSASATEAANAYLSKQAEVRDIYMDSSGAARLFIDDQTILNASADELNNTLIQSASSYEDYLAAIKEVNQAVSEQATSTNWLGAQVVDTKALIENSVFAVDELTFSAERSKDMALGSAESWEQYSYAIALSEQSAQKAAHANTLLATGQRTVTLSAEQNTALYKQLTTTLGSYNLTQTAAARAEQTLAVQMGLTTQLSTMQSDAINVLGAAYANGELTLNQYRSASEQVMLVNANSPAGYQALAEVVQGATGNYNALNGSVATLPGQMAALSDAATAAAVTAEEMSQRAKAAWETFAGNVKSGVASALDAYKSGNAEMLAEQQAALANMLLNQTNQMLALGQITKDQATGMKAAISTEFGLTVDDTQLTTDALLGMYSDWAAGGQTSADQIVSFIQNIGTESETLSAREEAATQREITAWQNAQAQTETTSAAFDERMTLMGESAETSAGVIEGGFTSMGGAAETMSGQVQGASSAASSEIEKIGTAINNLPSYKDIEIHVRQTGDKSTQFGSPQLRLYYGIQDLVEYAATHPVEVDVATKVSDGNMQLNTGRLTLSALMQGVNAPALSPTIAPASNVNNGGNYDQRKVELNMPVTALSNSVDIELLARRVVALIQQHQG